MRVLLCLLLFLVCLLPHIALAQTTDIDLTVLQEFKIQQDQKLQAFKNQQRNELAQVEQRQILTLLLEQVEHQKALVIQLGGATIRQVSVSQVSSVIQQQCIDDL